MSETHAQFGSPEEALRYCYVGVANILQNSAEVPEEWKQWLTNKVDGGEPLKGDPISLLANQMEIVDASQFPANKQVEKIGNMINNTIMTRLRNISFVSKYTIPSSFYESNQYIYEIAKELQTPISYAEGAEVLGIATINPIAGVVMKEKLTHFIKDQYNMTPFIHINLISLSDWFVMCDRHFQMI